MKKLTILAAILALSTLSFGQRLMIGEKQVNAGFGLNSNNWGIPIYVGIDYGIYPDITVGGIFSYAKSDNDHGNASWFSLGGRGDYHFNTLLEIPDEWDVYGGASLVYNSFSYDKNYNKKESSGIGIGLQIGARYYFQDNLAVNLEFGGGDIASAARIGITYKF